MRSVKTISVILLITAAIVACKKSSDKPATSSSSPFFMKARVDSASFSTVYCATYFSQNSDTFFIQGYNLADTLTQVHSYPQIMLCLYHYGITPGTFLIGGNSGNTAFYITGPTTSVQALYGSITMLTIPYAIASDTPVTGTFHFTCTDSTFVSGGTYTASLWYGLL